MPLQILRLVSNLFHETGRSQGRFIVKNTKDTYYNSLCYFVNIYHA
jgi:hypothetical protein